MHREETLAELCMWPMVERSPSLLKAPSSIPSTKQNQVKSLLCAAEEHGACTGTVPWTEEEESGKRTKRGRDAPTSRGDGTQGLPCHTMHLPAARSLFPCVWGGDTSCSHSHRHISRHPQGHRGRAGRLGSLCQWTDGEGLARRHRTRIWRLEEQRHLIQKSGIGEKGKLPLCCTANCASHMYGPRKENILLGCCRENLGFVFFFSPLRQGI